ncbi:MAG TPA: IPT/TIG domain-containing protein [Solirubrobacterales bacterium]|nr:IPT/TIG domain-containing protein [Solirubrobacterales bacterium]
MRIDSTRNRAWIVILCACVAILPIGLLLLALAGTADASGRPSLASIEPNHGPIGGGTSVTITGANFTGATGVMFGEASAASFTVNSDESITAVSPSRTPQRLVDVTVTGPGGTSYWTPDDRFGYGPITTRFDPRVGPAAGGTPVTISGFGLGSTMAVDFGSHPATRFTVNPDGSIVAISPPSAGDSGKVRPTVTTAEGVSVYVNPEYECLSCWPPGYFWYGPQVTQVEPSSGPQDGGTAVTIRGANFLIPFWQSATLKVMFGSAEAADINLRSETELTAISPPGGGTVDVEVLTGPGTSPTTSADRFTYAHGGTVGTLMPPSVRPWGLIKPSKLPRSRPRPALLRTGFTSEAPDGGPTPELRRISLDVSRNVAFDTGGLPSCPLAKLFSSYASPLGTCPDSLVGRGGVVSEVTLPGQQPVTLVGNLLAFYDFARGQPRILARVTTGEPLPLTYVIPFQIEKAKGAFGTSLVVPKMRNIRGKCRRRYPNCFAQPYTLKGIYGHISKLEFSLHRLFKPLQGKRESLISARCPAPAPRSSASFPLERLSLRYSTGEQTSGVVSRRCNVLSG